MNGREVRQKIKEAGYSLADVALLIKVSPQNLQNKLKSKDVKIEFLQSVARAINKSVYYFLGDDEKNVHLNVHPNVYLIDKKSHLDLTDEKNSRLHFQITGTRRKKIILVPVKAQAGYLAGYGDQEWIEQLETYSIPGCTNGNYRMFEIEGESMFPTFSPGDFVVGRSENDCNSIKEGTIYIIVSRTEGIIIKRVLNAKKTPGKLLLGSDNTSFKPLELECTAVAEMWQFYMLLTTLPGDQDPATTRLRNLEQEVANIKQSLARR